MYILKMIFAATTLALVVIVSVVVAPADPESAEITTPGYMVSEDDGRFDCRTMGNLVCGRSFFG